MVARSFLTRITLSAALPLALMLAGASCAGGARAVTVIGADEVENIVAEETLRDPAWRS